MTELNEADMATVRAALVQGIANAEHWSKQPIHQILRESYLRDKQDFERLYDKLTAEESP